jgi:RNA polymerase sigma-70 factor (ECF subfamily)
MTDTKMNNDSPDPRRWVERYADYLYSYAFIRLDQEEQARDLVQETFLAALEKVSEFRANSSERTWLTAILKKEAYSPQPMRMEGADPMANKELAAILKKCLQRLPALWLSVFTMKHLDEATTDIICKELKLTASNFWVIIHRAKLNLRACIQKSW